MRWTIAKARQQFAELVRAAEHDPQAVYRRDQLAAVLIGTKEYQDFLAWKTCQGSLPSLADSFVELRHLAAEEDWCLALRSREDRPNLLAEVLDALPR